MVKQPRASGAGARQTLLQRPGALFVAGGLLFFVIVQVLLSFEVLNNFWRGIIYWGAAITMVALGLNLIYGFCGQFSLGQYGFYAIGSYAAADVTWRWTHSDPSGIVVVLFGSLLALLFYVGVSKLLGAFYRVNVMTFHFLRHRDHRGVRYHGAVPGAVPWPCRYRSAQRVPGRHFRQGRLLHCTAGQALSPWRIAKFLFGIPVLELKLQTSSYRDVEFYRHCEGPAR